MITLGILGVVLFVVGPTLLMRGSNPAAEWDKLSGSGKAWTCELARMNKDLR